MNIMTRTREYVACIALVAMLPILAACGGGENGDGFSDAVMMQCTVRPTSNFGIISYPCISEWAVVGNQPVFTSVSDCWVAVDIRKATEANVVGGPCSGSFCRIKLTCRFASQVL